jgi:hypothetical protein
VSTPFEGTQEKLYPTRRTYMNNWDDTLMHDTPSDCLFDDDPENPRPEQTLEGLDKRDYGHWTQRQEDARLEATGRGRNYRTRGTTPPLLPPRSLYRKKKVQTND